MFLRYMTCRKRAKRDSSPAFFIDLLALRYRELQIPAYGPKDHFSGEMTACELSLDLVHRRPPAMVSILADPRPLDKVCNRTTSRVMSAPIEKRSEIVPGRVFLGQM